MSVLHMEVWKPRSHEGCVCLRCSFPLTTYMLHAQSLNIGKLDVPLCALTHLHRLFGSTSVTLYYWSLCFHRQNWPLNTGDSLGRGTLNASKDFPLPIIVCWRAVVRIKQHFSARTKEPFAVLITKNINVPFWQKGKVTTKILASVHAHCVWCISVACVVCDTHQQSLCPLQQPAAPKQVCGAAWNVFVSTSSCYIFSKQYLHFSSTSFTLDVIRWC